jgi:DNA polymerase-3 subunit alpha
MFNNKKVFDLISSGKVNGIFQLEGYDGRIYSKKVRPTNIDQLSDLLALIRPGAKASGQIDLYIRRKNGEEEISYPHDILEPILKQTYGTILYQEQAIAAAKIMAKWDLKQADILRYAIGKKKEELMNSLKPKFYADCENNGIDIESIDKVWDVFSASAAYSFNKCITGKTKIKTDKGIKTIEEIDNLIKKGSKVTLLSYNYKEDKIEYSMCTEVIKCGNHTVYEITLSNNKKVQCTLDHHFLCADGKKYSLRDIIKYNKSILSV